MPIYDIYALGESNLTISGGAQLDGVTQGDGSHLVPPPPAAPITITINTPNWQAISINDSDDPNFQDSDSSQRLNGDQTFDGVFYTGNPVVEAEYGITVTDGVDTWTLVGFNINNSSPAYGTVEGLAVIGGPGGFPPAGVALTVLTAFEGPSFAATEYATPICFAGGTQIACAEGTKAIEALCVGDMVQTDGGGLQPVRWIGRRLVPAVGKLAPVEFAAGVLGNERALRVSQQHRVLVEGWRSELLWSEPRVLVPAHRLVNGRNVRRVPGWMVLYVHVLLDRHDLIWAEGALCESLYPGAETFEILGPQAARQIKSIMDRNCTTSKILAAPLIKGSEAGAGAGSF